MIGSRVLQEIAREVNILNNTEHTMGAFVLAAQQRLYGSGLAGLPEHEWHELSEFVNRTYARHAAD
jgi:hypothetical protein